MRCLEKERPWTVLLQLLSWQQWADLKEKKSNWSAGEVGVCDKAHSSKTTSPFLVTSYEKDFWCASVCLINLIFEIFSALISILSSLTSHTEGSQQLRKVLWENHYQYVQYALIKISSFSNFKHIKAFPFRIKDALAITSLNNTMKKTVPETWFCHIQYVQTWNL